MLEQSSIHAFIDKYDIKTDNGILLDFRDHAFMWDVYSDLSPKQAIMKAAQVTMSTCAILKVFWIAKYKGINAIYTLPTESDRNTFVGGKVNRLVSQNPILQEWVKDKDAVEQKQVGDNLIYFRGTWTQKAAIMVSSDLNVYDEVDSSKQDIIEQYSTRLQHSQKKWEWFFSHPSASGAGVDRYWRISDQKHWFIKCGLCEKEQFMSWPESIDLERKIYQCKFCKKELTNEDRRQGRWIKKFINKNISGYWIPLLICPWVPASEIIDYHKNKTEEYFYNKVLGLPYVGGGNKLTWEAFAKNLTEEILTPTTDQPAVMGIDTGLKLDYVMSGLKGLFYHGEAKDYDELDRQMERWPKMIAVIDAGGDLIGSRKFYEKWRGRCYLCHLAGDRKTMELVRWGENEEYGNVVADRNRLIQLVVDEFGDGRIPVQGTEQDWRDYWTDWDNLTRVKVLDPLTGEIKGTKWIRSGRDHKCSATIFYRVGMMRIGVGGGSIIGSSTFSAIAPLAPEISLDSTIPAITPGGDDLVEKTIEQLREQGSDWRG